ncbi:MAG: glycosyltransferase [Anaerolineaceae bacterium]|nr:glycosyltransferase [Anaerolineaceae bacterium]
MLRSFAEKVKKHPGWIFQLTGCAAQTEHIPFVLQHRSVSSRHLAQQVSKDYAGEVQAALCTRGYVDARTDVNPAGQIRVSWRSPSPKVSIIIPTKNNLEFIQRCLSSLLEKTVFPDFEIILIDDHSTDKNVLEYYQQIQSSDPRVQVHPNETAFNYSGVNNMGARLAKGSLLLFLNNDTEILDSDWLSEMVRWVLMPGAGMVGT